MQYFNLPFTEPRGWPLAKVVLVSLLLVHAIWIIVHINLVSRELINPWKLGGYGMYTVANARPILQVYRVGFGIQRVPKKDYLEARFWVAHHRHAFRCRPFSEKAFRIFFRENPDMVGTDLRFIVWERRMERKPIGAKRVPQSIADVRWNTPSTFSIRGTVCGQSYESDVQFKP
jgi:hypothetical protein